MVRTPSQGSEASALSERVIFEPLTALSVRLALEPQHLHVDHVADGQDVLGLLDAVVAELAHGHEPFHPADVDERAEVANLGDPARHHDPLRERRLELGAGLRRLALQQAAAGEDHVAILQLDHLEAQGLADERARILHEADVELRHGAEAAHASDLDLGAALVDAGHAAFDRDALLPGELELRATGLLAQRGAELDLRAVAIDPEHVPAHFVAELHHQLALRTGQIRPGEPALLFGVEIDEDRVRAEVRDHTFHLVAHRETARGGAHVLFAGE